ARKLSVVSFEEMLEMAASGAGVLQLRSVEYARNHGVRIHCRSSFEDGPGTFVLDEQETMERPLVTAVTHSLGDARITLTSLPDRPGIAGKVLTALADANVNVDDIIQNEPVSEDHRADMSFTVPKDDLPAAKQAREGIKAELGTGRIDAVDLSEFDLALFSAGGGVSEEWAPKFVSAGAVVVDNSSFWRMHDDVPLVVAEVNPDAIESHRGIVANPNCSTMQMVVALKPIDDAAGIERLVVSTYQSVSGTGQKAVEELIDQAHMLLHEQEPEAPSVYPHRIAFNVLPQVERFKDGDDYTTEERKMMAETRKILGHDDIGISA